ncbi:MAG: hypothetical protein GY845_37615 [Planctomycetes bacterium]|nr:hypothetical protein [Planctomycetota bacterium]
METFIKLKDFVDNPRYQEQRRAYLSKLNIKAIDAPIVEIVSGFAKLPYCFTLQSCYGHFVFSHQKDPHNIEPLPISDSLARVQYRIAYIALCLENSDLGRALFQDLGEIPVIDPEYVQFGCATWFWNRQVNSYALQVEPRRHMTKDKATVDYKQALHIEKVRNEFFAQLKKMLQKQLERNECG